MADAPGPQLQDPPPPRPENYPEISHSKAVVMLHNGKAQKVECQFDRQARPHLVLTCKNLNGRSLPIKKPSYWDLPPSTQASLLQKQFQVGREVTEKLGLPESTFTAAIHLGEWASSHHIHSHIILPLQPYFRLFSEYREKESWDEEDCERRMQFLKLQDYSRSKYHAKDLAKVLREVAKNVVWPDINNLVERFHLTFDPSGEGTSAMDVHFGESFHKMNHQDHTQVLQDLNELVKEHLCMKGCHYYFPAPGNVACDTVRVVCPPEVFVRFLPPEQRGTWAEKWAVWGKGGPIHRAGCDDLSELPLPLPAL